MGNSSSSGRAHQEETVDFGYLVPQGIYTGPRDWNQPIVTQLIIDRKLAPFYRPLEDYEDGWDDDQIVAAMKGPSQPDGVDGEAIITRAESIHSTTSRTHHKRPSAATKEPVRHQETIVYRGSVECPICFLYYPPNINRSRCCDQAICTECFVQIKRADPTTTHLVSEPACCPYCVRDNFGIVYTPPPWRAGIGSEGSTPPPSSDVRGASEVTAKKRRKSFDADSPEVVTIDQIRPDWEAKLAAVRAAVARRANRRIIMRQVGDRLIPVGITSGRVHALPAEDMPDGDGGGNERGSRRRRRNQNADLNQYLGTMGLGGQDLEELMVMEALRLSLIEHEEQMRKQKEEEDKKKKQAEGGTAPAPAPAAGEAEAAGSSSAATGASAVSSTRPTSVSSPTDSSPGLPIPLVPNSPPSAFSHRSSSSISRVAGHGASNSLDAGCGGPGRTPSPLSAIGTAIRSATSTANAVGSPPPGSVAHANANPSATASARNSVIGSNVPSSASVTLADTAPTPISTSTSTVSAPQTEAAAPPTTSRSPVSAPASSSEPTSAPASTITSPAFFMTPTTAHPLTASTGSDTATSTSTSTSTPTATAVSSPQLLTRSLMSTSHTPSSSTLSASLSPVPIPVPTQTQIQTRPIQERTSSFASSLLSTGTTDTVNGEGGEAYDYLPSSPSSSAESLAGKPLLNGEGNGEVDLGNGNGAAVDQGFA